LPTTSRNRLGSATAAALALLSLLGSPAGAQDSISFSRIELSVAAQRTIHAGDIDRFWRTRPSFRLTALAPYGVGALRIAVEFGRQPARQSGTPSYASFFPSLEWGLTPALPLGFQAYAGAGFGAYWMGFDAGGNRHEMEMALGGTAILRRSFLGWTVGAGLHARRVMLYEPLPQVLFFLEVGRSGRTPALLRRALEGAADSTDLAVDSTAEQASAGSLVVARTRRSDSDEIRRTGARQLSDVLRALPDWDRTSLDRRTSWITPEGLAPFDGARADVLVDGIPVPLDLFGTLSLDRLPLELVAIDSLKARSLPGLGDGRFEPLGSLTFTTRHPRTGLALGAEGVLENPTDDPGPFRYADSPAPNVDKAGGAYSALVSGTRGWLSASAGLKYVSDFVTDEGFQSRPISLRDPRVHYPMIPTWAGWGSLRIAVASSRHTVRAGGSTRDDYLFLPMVGFEVPTEVHHWHTGASGEQRLGGALRFRYQAYISSEDLRESANDLDLTFDLLQMRRGLSAGLVRDGRLSWTLGGGIDGDRVRSRLLAAPSDRATAHARASVGAAVGELRVGIEGELRRTEGATSGDVALRGETGPASFTAWRTSSSPAEQGGYWGLHRRGYGFLSSLGIEVEEVAGPRDRVEEGAHLELAWNAGPVRLTPFARVSRSRGLMLSQSSLVLEEIRPEHDGPVRLTGAALGSHWMAGTELRWTPLEQLRIEARYRWLRVTSGDAFYRSAWASTPEHRYLQRVVWSPRGDLRLGWGIEGRSATTWSAFARMGRAQLPGHVVSELFAEKSLWEGRAHLCARISDVTDRERPLHPMGAAPGLSFAICGALRVGG
jgi:hypothetical protein